MRLIDADALIKELNKNKYYVTYKVFEIVDNAPTVEIPTELCKGCRFLKDCETCEKKLIPQGKWIPNYISQFFNPGRSCSLCGKTVEFSENYCPNCGAYMRGGEDNG